MTHVAPITQRPSVSNPLLWAIENYLSLITKDGDLVYGSGLQRLYTMSHGLMTYNHDDVADATSKALQLGIVPQTLKAFMISSIINNCHLYANLLKELISDQIVKIARGDLVNPEPGIGHSQDRARRYYYTPPIHFVVRLQKAISQTQWGGIPEYPTSIRLSDIANDGDHLLNQYRGIEGVNTPQSTSFGALMGCVERLVSIIGYSHEKSAHIDEDYRVAARPALKVLWVISKLLTADLTVEPATKDLNLINLDDKIHMTDGTLAAIPFPIPQALDLFRDEETPTISMKGRFYLSAIAAAAFYRRDRNEEG